MSSKILIIGAGATALMAARHLAEQQYDVTVVEARDRIGGRIHAIANGFSVPVEAGAEFMHGRQPLTTALISESENEAYLLSGMRYQLWEGTLQKGDFFGDQWSLLEEAVHKLEADMDIERFLATYFPDDRYAGLRQKVQAFAEGFDAADVRRASTQEIIREWAESDDAHQYRIEGGYIRLMRHLESKIEKAGGKFLLSAPVREIRWSAGKVTLLTETGNVLEGDKVIITVPLGVLQRRAITVSPALPEQQRALDVMGFGGVVKVAVEFDDGFWHDHIATRYPAFSFIFSDAAVPTWWSQHPRKVPLITGWIGGPSSFAFSDDAGQVLKKAVASLAYIFNCPVSEIESQARQSRVINWSADPYTLGAYAYPTMGSAAAIRFLSSPVANTLFFAGEALYTGTAVGTVEAALVSGQDVARKIVDGLSSV